MSYASPGRRFVLNLVLLTGIAFRINAQDQIIYSDTALSNGWNDWSYFGNRDFANTAFFHSGSSSIAFTLTSAWGGLSLEHNNINSAFYTNLTFWVNGGSTGGQLLQVYAEAPLGTNHANVLLSALPTNSWKQITLSLASLGVANVTNFSRFTIQDRTGGVQPTFYVDDIALVTNGTPLPAISLTSPADGSSYPAPASISLAASVTPNGHTITKVQFYNNGSTLLNEDTNSPYSFSWTNVGIGTYSLTARLVYDAGTTLDSGAANVTVTGTTNLTINVDAQASRHAISPLIYGVAFASAAELSDLNFTLNRSGGNNETRYNWQLNAHNIDFDWYFESVSDGPATPGAATDDFITASKAGGAQPMVTIPMIEWAAKLGSGRSTIGSYSTTKYGAQQSSDPYNSQWGNGKTPAGVAITTNDPNDANYPVDVTFQQGYVQHLMTTWGNSTNGGVKYYFMDNEHSIWFSTHQDIHPIGPSMEEIRDKMFNYAGMVKSNDPNATVLGPEEFGWSGYLYSGYDLWYTGLHGYSVFPDRVAHGNMDYMPWLLGQFYQRDTANGQRLLDYFTLHCYPEDNNVAGNAVDTNTQLLRNRLTRKFWDPTYIDETWIGSQSPPYNIVKLIPRMKGWVANYPGTKIGVTEYNWGAEGHINGATAQADIMGIFGRENLDLATRWTTPTNTSPTYKAMKMYRNYDGSKSAFGDISVSAGQPDPNSYGAYAAQRSSDGTMTVMVINKQLNAAAALTINFANFTPAGTAQVWQLTAANTISHLSDVSLTGNTLSYTVPIQSVTLFVLPAGTVVPPPPQLTGAAIPSPGTFTFMLTNGVAGQRYVIQSSTDLSSWTPVQTNTLTGTTNGYLFPVPDVQHFYRAQWQP
jgi:hypothetical protein